MFKNRQDAGKKLAEALQKYKNTKNTVAIALPRGGVVVGFEIAKALNLPLDIVVPRKIGAPDNPEYAIGAITETGDAIFNAGEIKYIDKKYLESEIKKEKQEAERRLNLYRQNKPPRNLKNKTVIIIDDGLATGLTMLAAIKTAKTEKAKKIIAAVPVAAADSLEKIKKQVAETVCLLVPPHFGAVGQFYEKFGQTTDEEVIKLIVRNNSLVYTF